MRSKFSFILALFLVLSLVGLGAGAPAAEAAKPVKNLILLIGDGMGFGQLTAARIVKGESLYMDGFPVVGTASTYPNDPQEKWVTDSAAAGTALATGVKSYNAAISVDVNRKPVKTILEAAQEAGKATGLVTTTRITHATPAVFAAHHVNRDAEQEIAVDMLNHNVDVLLGGGKGYFVPAAQKGKRTDGRDLIAEARSKGYTFVETKDELNKVTGGKVLGLFKSSHLSYELDRDPAREPSLAEMTRKAIELLSRDPDGFFLMVEGGRIDHASHAHDAAAAVYDTLAFDEAVGVALDFALRNPDTLVVVTADHETGGLSVGGYGQYNFKPEVLKAAKGSFEDVIAAKLTESNVKEVMAQYTGVTDLSAEEVKALQEALRNKAKDPYGAANFAAELVSKRALVGWTSSGHTGADVPVFAFGPAANSGVT
ncbi:MAG: alkaline phosphatase [Bacillota bacterium]|nr:alkaline phosphatase [Bacillota bacterium]